MPSSVAKCIFPPLWILLAVFGCVVAGCGVKGPPVPPTHESLPGVRLISAQTTVDGYVTLTWKQEGPLERKDAQSAVFVVLQSRNSIDAPLCETCPMVFERVATLPYTDTPDGQFSAEIPLALGYQYRFKVRLESGPSTSADSPLLQVNSPSPSSEKIKSP
ncbi:lipoprotein [Desulfosarcina sp. OttesenSCG-928-A07]|nr:lipoprotein [Desulfosarcina sp. OttesenSCG-928-A07]